MAGITTANQVTFEDLSKAGEVLDQRSTPFWSRLKNGEAPRALVYFQGISRMGKRRRQGKPERQDIKGFEGDEGKKIGGRMEYFHRDPQISTEAEAFKMNQAVPDLADYDKQVTKKIKEGNRDIEFKALSDQESQEDDGINGYFFRGAGRLINDGTTGAATSQGGDSPTSYTAGTADLAFNDTATAIPAAYRTPTAQIYAGALADLSEETLLDMMQSRATRAGMSSEFTLWCGYALKRKMNDFGRYVLNHAGYDTVVRTDRAMIDKGRLNLSGPDVFQGDYGVVTVELDPWMPTNSRGYGMDMSRCEKKVVFAARHHELENKAGGRRGFIEWIVGPWFDDPRAHFKICPSDETAALVDFDA